MNPLMDTWSMTLESRLGRGINPRPPTKGATPPWNPLEQFPVIGHEELLVNKLSK